GGANAEQPAFERCIVLGPGEGRVLSLRPGDDVTLKAVSGETGGVFSFGEYSAAPASAGPPLHVHDRADEAAYVLEGEFTIGRGRAPARSSTSTTSSCTPTRI